MYQWHRLLRACVHSDSLMSLLVFLEQERNTMLQSKLTTTEVQMKALQSQVTTFLCLRIAN